MAIGELLGVDFYEVINTPTAVEWNQNPQKVIDFDLSQLTMVMQTDDKRLYIAGMKLYFNPTLIPIDYENNKIRTFCATQKGVALVTEENKVFAMGSFWNSKEKDENVSTGLSELKIDKYLEGREIVKIGGRFEGSYALVK